MTTAFCRHLVRTLIASTSAAPSSATSSGLPTVAHRVWNKRQTNDHMNFSIRFMSTTSIARSDARLAGAPVGTISIDYSSSRPTITIPLPSYDALCIFTLRPVSHSLADLCRHIQDEDPGIDCVIMYKDNARMAGSTPIESLLSQKGGTQHKNLILRINDKHYNIDHVNVPVVHSHLTSEELPSTVQMKTEIASLYAALQVDEHQLGQEREILQLLEELNEQLMPLEEKRKKVMADAEKRAELAGWLGLAAMGIQCGTFARLTWWEYSWDIMEPVTYFATYIAQIGMFSYWLMTKQNFEYDGAKKRVLWRSFYTKAKLHQFDIEGYNSLRTRIEELEHDLKRIRDPLHMHLPLNRLQTLKARKRAAEAEALPNNQSTGENM